MCHGRGEFAGNVTRMRSSETRECVDHRVATFDEFHWLSWSHVRRKLKRRGSANVTQHPHESLKLPPKREKNDFFKDWQPREPRKKKSQKTRQPKISPRAFDNNYKNIIALKSRWGGGGRGSRKKTKSNAKRSREKEKEEVEPERSDIIH